MAVVLQQATAGVADGTFSQYLPLDHGGQGIAPFAQQVHRGALALDGTTGTDTASLEVSLPLPENVVWQLRTFFCSIAGDNGEYSRGVFEYQYAPTIQKVAPTRLDFPMFAGSVLLATGAAVTNWVLGTADDPVAATGAWVNSQPEPQSPFPLLCYAPVGSTAPLLTWRSVTAPTDTTATLSFNLTWLGYTYEQMVDARLHMGLNNRQ